MTDMEKMIVLGCTVDSINAENGYKGKSVIPWGLVALNVGLDILNWSIKDCGKSSYRSHPEYRRKHF